VLTLDPSRRRALHRALLAWAREHGRSFPWRETDDPYAVLVAELLLQKTASYKVARVYPSFIERFPTVEALATARQADVLQVIRPLGLPRRAELLTTLAGIIRDKHHSVVPTKTTDLQALPGVGRYTAHAVQCLTRNKPQPLVDEVVARVYRRLFGLDSSRRAYADNELWELVRWLIPRRRSRAFALGVLDLAAGVCTSSNPRCMQCPLRKQCAYNSCAEARQTGLNDAPDVRQQGRVRRQQEIVA